MSYFVPELGKAATRIIVQLLSSPLYTPKNILKSSKLDQSQKSLAKIVRLKLSVGSE